LLEELKNKLSNIDIIGLAFSCFFVVYGLINISDTPWIQKVMGALGLYVEWRAVNIYLLSFICEKLGKKTLARWLRGTWIYYVLVFGLMAAIGFFATEINVQETASKKVETIEKNNQGQINRLNKLLDIAIEQQQKEGQITNGGKTAVGSNYRFLQQKIDGYNEQIKQLTAEQKTPVKVVKEKTQMKDMFENISKVMFGIPKYFFILLMFGSAMAMMYLGIALKPIEKKFKEQLKALEERGKMSDESNKAPELPPALPTASDTISPNLDDTSFLTSEQLKKLDFINALWGDSKEELPTHLTPLEKTGFPERTANRYSDYFRDIGAIEKVQGRPCKPKWPLSRIIRYVENEGVS
jgi:hypothetical protein